MEKFQRLPCVVGGHVVCHYCEISRLPCVIGGRVVCHYGEIPKAPMFCRSSCCVPLWRNSKGSHVLLVVVLCAIMEKFQRLPCFVGGCVVCHYGEIPKAPMFFRWSCCVPLL